MLRKLLKYDLRANMKLYLFIWPAMLLLAGLQRLLLEAGLTVLAAVANMILRVYFVSCLGHLFRRARIFLSILFYYLIGVLMQIASMMMLVSVNYEPNTFVNSVFTWVESLSFNGAMSAFLGTILLINVAIGCVYFFVSEVILRKRLNLE